MNIDYEPSDNWLAESMECIADDNSIPANIGIRGLEYGDNLYEGIEWDYTFMKGEVA